MPVTAHSIFREILLLQKNSGSKTPDNPVAIQKVKLLQRRWLSKYVFEIELTRPPDWDFKPGQTICFIHGSLERYYSLLSIPGAATLEICVYSVPGGIFSPVLADAEIGTTFDATGPHGYFTFNHSERTPVFVATGTGIAPFVSMGRSGIAGFTLLHEVESTAELCYQDLFREIESHYFPCLTETSSAGPVPPDTFHGRAAEFIKKNLPPAEYDFYLCGERKMTREVTLLVDEQFPGSFVFKEVFY